MARGSKGCPSERATWGKLERSTLTILLTVRTRYRRRARALRDETVPCLRSLSLLYACGGDAAPVAHRRGPASPEAAAADRPYQLRERRAQVGELVQTDSSPHAWLEQRGPRRTLLAFVDDASSALQYAHFVPVETSRAYLQGLRPYVDWSAG